MKSKPEVDDKTLQKDQEIPDINHSHEIVNIIYWRTKLPQLCI